MTLTARVVLALCLFPLPALTQTPMTGAEFEAYVTGKTITYHQFDAPYGVEEYLSGRKVRWAFTANECQYGTWYEAGEEICFVYDYDPVPQCWTFWVDARGLNGLFSGNGAGEELTEVEQSDQPLPCPGPDLGV